MNIEVIEQFVSKYPGLLAIILALFAAILTIILYIPTFLQWVFSRKKNIRKNFRIVWRWGLFLRRKNLLIGRPSNKYYMKRDVDEYIREAVKNRKNTIVTGKPTSGKTRSIYEAIKKRAFWRDILVARHEPIEIKEFSIPKHFRFWHRKLIIIDDLHLFVSQQNFHYLFEEADKKGIPIIATCRSGADFENTKKAMEDKNLSLEMVFQDCIFELGIVTEETAKKIAKKTNEKWDSVDFDGTVGSVFMGVIKMRDRYRNILTNEERDILRLMKKMYITGVYAEDYVFPRQWFETVAKFDDIEKDKKEWSRVYEKLVEYEFLTWYEGHLKGEEVYFEKVIELTPQTDKFAVWREMIDTFADEPEALFRLGDRAYYSGQYVLDKATYMKVAIDAYLGALRGYTIENNPEKYGWVNNNLAIAFSRLAEVEDKAANCRRAITACEEAFKVFTVDAFPMGYAMMQSSLANAYNTLGEVVEKAANCRCAITACEEALKVLTKDAFPMDYATMKNNLGAAYQTLSQVEDKVANCRLAIIAYEEALKIHTLDAYPIGYAMTQSNLAIAYCAIGKKDQIVGNFQRSIMACEEAMKVYTINSFPMNYAAVQSNLAGIYIGISNIENTEANCRNAIKSYEGALKVFKYDKFPMDYAKVCWGIGVIFLTLANVQDKNENCRKALDYYTKAYNILSEQGIYEECESIENNIAILQEFCGGDLEDKK